MPPTNFPNGLSSMGVPVLGGEGLLTQGKSFFVNPRLGSDGNNGLSPAKAFATLAKAHDMCTAGQNDVVYLLAAGALGSDTTDYLSSTLTWSKNNTHLIGIGSPSSISQRARIAQLGSATSVSPLMDITANGCIFRNFSIFQGVNDTASLINVRVTGQRNYFDNVHIAGIGDATMGDQAGARSLKVTGSENTFKHCTIGLDTVARSTTNAELELSGAATRNIFEDCLFLSFADNAGHVFLTAPDGGGIDRFCLFIRCIFLNAIKSTATTMTEAFNVSATVGGLLLVKDCTLLGATDWEAASVSGNTYIDGAAATNNTSGLAVVVA